jgi:hypothetical protein
VAIKAVQVPRYKAKQAALGFFISTPGGYGIAGLENFLMNGRHRGGMSTLMMIVW